MSMSRSGCKEKKYTHQRYSFIKCLITRYSPIDYIKLMFFTSFKRAKERGTRETVMPAPEVTVLGPETTKIRSLWDCCVLMRPKSKGLLKIRASNCATEARSANASGEVRTPDLILTSVLVVCIWLFGLI